MSETVVTVTVHPDFENDRFLYALSISPKAKYPIETYAERISVKGGFVVLKPIEVARAVSELIAWKIADRHEGASA